MPRRNTAPGIQLQGITQSLNAPGIATPQYNYVTGKAFSPMARDLDTILDIMTGAGKVASAIKKKDALARGRGAEKAALDAAMLKVEFEAGPTKENLAMFPSRDVTVGDPDSLNRWVAGMMQTRIGDMDENEAAGYISEMAPHLIAFGGKYVSQRFDSDEDGRVRTAAWSLATDTTTPIHDQQIAIFDQLQKEYTDVEFTDLVMLPAAQTAILSGKYKHALNLLGSTISPKTKEGMAVLNSAYQDLLPALQKATFDILTTQPEEAIGWGEYNAMVHKFEQFTGDKANEFITNGFASWLAENPPSQSEAAMKVAQQFIFMNSTKGDPLWQNLRLEVFKYEEDIVAKETAARTAANARRLGSLRDAEAEGARLLATTDDPSALTTAETAMYADWQTKYPALFGVMKADYIKFKDTLGKAQQSPQTQATYVGFHNEIQNATSYDELGKIRDRVSISASDGNLTYEQFNKLTTSYNAESELIDGKQNETMLAIRDTLASEWDLRLGIETTPDRRFGRTIPKEYADSEWTRNALLNEFDREWRSWMRTDEVLKVIRTGDKDAFDNLVQEKIYGAGGMIEVWKPRINEALEKVKAAGKLLKQKKPGSGTTINPRLLTNSP